MISDIHYDKALFGYYQKDLLCDKDNVIWFVEKDWLASYDGKERNGYGFGPPPYSISSLAVGPKNEVWVAYSQGGVAEYIDTVWKVIPDEYGPLYDTTCFCLNREGTAWLGGNSSVLKKFQWDSSENLQSPLPDYYNAKSIVFENSNILWVSFTWGPLFDNPKETCVFSYNGSVWTKYTTANGLIDDDVNDITVDSANAKWFGTSAGISRYDDSTWSSFATTAAGDSLGSVNVLASGTGNIIWAGTNRGLLKYNGAAWTRLGTADGLVDSTVISLAVNSKGVVWAGDAERAFAV